MAKKISDVEIHRIPADDIIGINDEYWQPTCVLKWVEDRINDKTLYQRWVSNKGNYKWLELPIERG